MKIRVSSSDIFHLSGATGTISFLLFFLEREIGCGRWQRVAETRLFAFYKIRLRLRKYLIFNKIKLYYITQVFVELS